MMAMSMIARSFFRRERHTVIERRRFAGDPGVLERLMPSAKPTSAIIRPR